MSRTFWAVLVLLLFAPMASAHEGRPVLIKLAQDDAQLTVRWQVPPVVPAHAEPRVSLEGCTALHEAPNGLRGLSLYRCEGGIQQAQLRLDWPSLNPALSTLVELQNGQTQFFGPEQTRIPLNGFETARTDFASFIKTGIEHILLGFDHLCFILILTLIVVRSSDGQLWRRLALMVTGFTIAHSITLAAATFRLVYLPPLPVEAAIALSIVFVTAELARDRRNTITFRYPVLTASCFGLLHGFGFASVLADAGLPDQARLMALLGFNLGVELGQLAFVATVLFIIFFAGRFAVQRVKPFVLQGTTACIGTLATFWMIERILQF